MAFLDFEYRMRTDSDFRNKILKSVEDIIKTHSEMHKSLTHKKAYKDALSNYLKVSNFNIAPLLAYYYPNYPDGPYTLKDYPFAHCYYQLNLGENSYTCLRGSRQIGKCLTKDNMIKIRNKTTGKEEVLTIEEFFNRFSSSG